MKELNANMDGLPAAAIGQAVLDVQLLRRRLARDAREELQWTLETKKRHVDAEQRLQAITGLDLATALIRYNLFTSRKIGL